jgi:hypothetical protein
MTLQQTKDLTHKIIQHYIMKESQCENDYHWYFNNEFDSNVTAFEALNNARQLGIKTKLCHKDTKLILYLLSAILQENNYLMEKDGLDVYIDDEENDTLTTQYCTDKKKLYLYKDVTLWIKYLKIAVNDAESSEYDEEVCIDTQYIAKRFKNFKQCILKVDEINNDLRIIKSEIIKIEH